MYWQHSRVIGCKSIVESDHHFCGDDWSYSEQLWEMIYYVSGLYLGDHVCSICQPKWAIKKSNKNAPLKNLKTDFQLSKLYDSMGWIPSCITVNWRCSIKGRGSKIFAESSFTLFSRCPITKSMPECTPSLRVMFSGAYRGKWAWQK